MALVRQLQPLILERDARHLEVECTYSIIRDDEGEEYLQIDTYGSADRKLRGKKSQSLRFTREAAEQLKAILSGEF